MIPLLKYIENQSKKEGKKRAILTQGKRRYSTGAVSWYITATVQDEVPAPWLVIQGLCDRAADILQPCLPLLSVPFVIPSFPLICDDFSMLLFMLIPFTGMPFSSYSSFKTHPP